MVVDHGGGNSRPPTVVVQVCINASPVVFLFRDDERDSESEKDRGSREQVGTSSLSFGARFHWRQASTKFPTKLVHNIISFSHSSV